MIKSVLVLSLVALPIATAHADDHKDPAAATMLSLAGAAVPTAMVVGGLAAGDDALVSGGLLLSTVGPSIGHWYAGDYGTPGLAMRAGGFALALAGAVKSLDCGFLASPHGSEPSCTAGEGLVIAGGVAYAAGMIYDVATAGRAAKKHDASQVRIAPGLQPSFPAALTER